MRLITMHEEKTEAQKISDYRLDFERGLNHTSEQRDKCNADIRFDTVDGGHWEGGYEEQFQNRPKIQLPLISQAINRFYGEWLTNKATVKYRPKNTKAEKEAEILTGLYRADSRRRGGEFALNNAVLEAIRGGVGAFKISTEYEDELDDENDDQVIVFDPIYSAHSCVVFDPSAKRMDKADAKWCFILHELSDEAFRDQFPDVDPSSFAQINDRRSFNWSNGTTSYYVAERYEIVKKRTEVVTYKHPITEEKRTYESDEIKEVVDELADMGFEFVSEKKVTRKFVEKSVISGANEYLEEPKRIAGKYIPVVSLYAYWQYTDGQEFYWGMIRKFKDVVRLADMQVSALAEVAATSVKQVPIFTPDQMAGHQTNWSQAHLGKKNYQLINPIKNPDGTMSHVGPVGVVSPPAVDPALGALLDVSSGIIQQETGGNPQNVLDTEASGKAILATQQRVDMQTQSIMKNIEMALKYSGDVYASIAADTYNHTKVMTTLGIDDTENTVTLFESVMDEETGKIVQINDINQPFEVIPDVGPAFSSMRQNTMADLAELASTVGQTRAGDDYMPAIIAMTVANMDGVGLEDLKEFNNKKLIAMGMREPETDEEKAYAQELAQSQQGQADPMMIAAQAEMKKADADLQGAQNKQVDNKIKMFEAETDRLGLQVKAKEAGVKIENTQADTMGKMIDNQARIQKQRPRRLLLQQI